MKKPWKPSTRESPKESWLKGSKNMNRLEEFIWTVKEVITMETKNMKESGGKQMSNTKEAIEEFEKANKLLEQAAGHFANGMRLLKGKKKPEEEEGEEENEEELVSLMGKERL